MSDVIGTAKIVAEVDSSGVEVGVAKAKRSLADLGVSAKKSGEKASEPIKGIGDEGEKSSKKIDAATRSMIGSIQRASAALQAGSKSGSEYYKVLAGQRGIDTAALKPYLDQLDEAANKQGKAGVSAAQMANNLRMVGPQVTDIVTGLQAGQKPLTVFIQQGGQLKDVFGGIGPAAKALGGYIAGLINPYTLAAGAVAALAYAYYEGSKEADAYARSLILSGNAAGLTADRLKLMSERIAVAGTTQHEAAAALAAFAASSNIPADSLEKYAAVAVRTQMETGQAVSETVKQFSELGKDPVAASIKLNESTRFLTAEIYNQIKAMAEQGRIEDAAAAAQAAYANAATQRMDQLAGRMGVLQKLAKDTAFGFKLFWDAALDVGRPDTNFEKINTALVAREALEKQLQSAEKYGDQERIKYLKGQLDGNLAIINGLRAKGDAERKAAADSKASAEKTTQTVNLGKYLDDTKYADSKTKYSLEVKNENQAFQDAVKGFKVTSNEYEQAFARHKANLAQIAESNKDKIGIQIDKAKLGADLDKVKAQLAILADSYKNTEAILEAQRAAGLISEKDYYDKKRQMIKDNSDAEVKGLEADAARLKASKATGLEEIENKKKLVDIEAKIAIAKADATAKGKVLDIQQKKSVDQVTLSYLTARQAAQDYFDTQLRQQQRSLSGLGQGTQQRTFDSGVSQIEDKYAGQRRDLENNKAQLELRQDGKLTDAQKKEYDKQSSLIGEFQAKSIASYSVYYDDLMKKQGDWALGASEGLNNYLDDATNVFKQTENLVTDAFGGMEDSLVNFVKTGKLSFGDLANTVVADLARMQIKALETKLFGGIGGGTNWIGLAGSVIGAFGGTGAMASTASAMQGDALDNFLQLAGEMPGKAGGGAVLPGSLQRVNELGPELLSSGGKDFLMMGSQGGTVTPNNKLGGQTVTLSPTYNIKIDGSTDMARNQLMIHAAVQRGNAELVDQLRRARML